MEAACRDCGTLSRRVKERPLVQFKDISGCTACLCPAVTHSGRVVPAMVAVAYERIPQPRAAG